MVIEVNHESLEKVNSYNCTYRLDDIADQLVTNNTIRTLF